MSEREKKKFNVDVGNRLKEWRVNTKAVQSEIAEELGITDEQYRKLENGASGMKLEHVYVLFEKHKLDPTFLITGTQPETFDLDSYLNSCDKESRKVFLNRCLEYIKKYF